MNKREIFLFESVIMAANSTHFVFFYTTPERKFKAATFRYALTYSPHGELQAFKPTATKGFLIMPKRLRDILILKAFPTLPVRRI